MYASALFAGCKALPEGPVTPDGYRPPEPTKDNIENMVRSVIKNMVYVEGGDFYMGNIVCFPDRKEELVQKYEIENIFCFADSSPVHKVTLDSFSLSKYEISYYEYDLFTQATDRPWIQENYLKPQWWGSRDRSLEAAIERFSGRRTGELPAAIDWFQAYDYCRWLGAVTGLPIYLPTEAQWEYAARSRGQDYPYATDNGELDLGKNYQPIGKNHLSNLDQWPPNPLGIYNMSGNVNEWVLDWYDEEYYQASPSSNPKGPTDGSMKVLRGGSYINDPTGNNVFSRFYKEIDYTHDIERNTRFELHAGVASFLHGARCAIHLSEPIDIEHLELDLSMPAPDSRAEWLATKDGRTANNE
jgi:formylglycine-generating enzyme required for sulfatase activity